MMPVGYGARGDGGEAATRTSGHGHAKQAGRGDVPPSPYGMDRETSLERRQPSLERRRDDVDREAAYRQELQRRQEQLQQIRQQRQQMQTHQQHRQHQQTQARREGPPGASRAPTARSSKAQRYAAASRLADAQQQQQQQQRPAAPQQRRPAPARRKQRVITPEMVARRPIEMKNNVMMRSSHKDDGASVAGDSVNTEDTEQVANSRAANARRKRDARYAPMLETVDTFESMEMTVDTFRSLERNDTTGDDESKENPNPNVAGGGRAGGSADGGGDADKKAGDPDPPKNERAASAPAVLSPRGGPNQNRVRKETVENRFAKMAATAIKANKKHPSPGKEKKKPSPRRDDAAAASKKQSSPRQNEAPYADGKQPSARQDGAPAVSGKQPPPRQEDAPEASNKRPPTRQGDAPGTSRKGPAHERELPGQDERDDATASGKKQPPPKRESPRREDAPAADEEQHPPEREMPAVTAEGKPPRPTPEQNAPVAETAAKDERPPMQEAPAAESKPSILSLFRGKKSSGKEADKDRDKSGDIGSKGSKDSKDSSKNSKNSKNSKSSKGSKGSKDGKLRSRSKSRNRAKKDAAVRAEENADGKKSKADSSDGTSRSRKLALPLGGKGGKPPLGKKTSPAAAAENEPPKGVAAGAEPAPNSARPDDVGSGNDGKSSAVDNYNDGTDEGGRAKPPMGKKSSLVTVAEYDMSNSAVESVANAAPSISDEIEAVDSILSDLETIESLRTDLAKDGLDTEAEAALGHPSADAAPQHAEEAGKGTTVPLRERAPSFLQQAAKALGETAALLTTSGGGIETKPPTGEKSSSVTAAEYNLSNGAVENVNMAPSDGDELENVESIASDLETIESLRTDLTKESLESEAGVAFGPVPLRERTTSFLQRAAESLGETATLLAPALLTIDTSPRENASSVRKEVETPGGTTSLEVDTDLLVSPAVPSSALSPRNKEDVEIQLPTPVPQKGPVASKEIQSRVIATLNMEAEPTTEPPLEKNDGTNSQDRVDRLKRELLSLARSNTREEGDNDDGAEVDVARRAPPKIADTAAAPRAPIRDALSKKKERGREFVPKRKVPMADFVPKVEEEYDGSPKAGFGEDDGLSSMFPSGLSTISGKSPMGLSALAAARAASEDSGEEDSDGDDAPAVARQVSFRKRRSFADAKAKAEVKAKAEAKRKAEVKANAEAKAKAEADAKAIKAKAEAEAKAIKAEAKAKADAKAIKAKAEAKAIKAKAEAEARAIKGKEKPKKKLPALKSFLSKKKVVEKGADGAGSEEEEEEAECAPSKEEDERENRPVRKTLLGRKTKAAEEGAKRVPSKEESQERPSSKTLLYRKSKPNDEETRHAANEEEGEEERRPGPKSYLGRRSEVIEEETEYIEEHIEKYIKEENWEEERDEEDEAGEEGGGREEVYRKSEKRHRIPERAARTTKPPSHQQQRRHQQQQQRQQPPRHAKEEESEDSDLSIAMKSTLSNAEFISVQSSVTTDLEAFNYRPGVLKRAGSLVKNPGLAIGRHRSLSRQRREEKLPVAMKNGNRLREEEEEIAKRMKHGRAAARADNGKKEEFDVKGDPVEWKKGDKKGSKMNEDENKGVDEDANEGATKGAKKRVQKEVDDETPEYSAGATETRSAEADQLRERIVQDDAVEYEIAQDNTDEATPGVSYAESGSGDSMYDNEPEENDFLLSKGTFDDGGITREERRRVVIQQQQQVRFRAGHAAQTQTAIAQVDDGTQTSQNAQVDDGTQTWDEEEDFSGVGFPAVRTISSGIGQIGTVESRDCATQTSEEPEAIKPTAVVANTSTGNSIGKADEPHLGSFGHMMEAMGLFGAQICMGTSRTMVNCANTCSDNPTNRKVILLDVMEDDSDIVERGIKSPPSDAGRQYPQVQTMPPVLYPRQPSMPVSTPSTPQAQPAPSRGSSRGSAEEEAAGIFTRALAMALQTTIGEQERVAEPAIKPPRVDPRAGKIDPARQGGAQHNNDGNLDIHVGRRRRPLPDESVDGRFASPAQQRQKKPDVPRNIDVKPKTKKRQQPPPVVEEEGPEEEPEEEPQELKRTCSAGKAKKGISKIFKRLGKKR